MFGLPRESLIHAAALLASATTEKDLAIATEVARLFECKDHYELATLEFFRYLHALEKIQERLKDTPEIL